jgi:molecular chaperone DnaK (HSP70)
MATCIGIDLGTTHTTIAYAAENEMPPRSFPIPQVIAPGEVAPRELLPSFLYRPSSAEAVTPLPWPSDDVVGRDLVGTLARTQGAATPARLVQSAKSWLSYSGVDRRADILPWQAPSDVPKMSPLEASARYLMHVRHAWEEANPKLPLAEQDVVLTVPASFDAIARDLTLEAARQAGLPESTRLLEEPQAALYAWLADRGLDWRKELRVGDVILVIDIGGGTTDFSSIAVRENAGELTLERVAVGDHILLGGDNMDLALAYAVRARHEAGGGKPLDDWQVRELTHAARIGKETLLGNPALKEHPIAIAGRGSKLLGGTVRLQLTREDVEAVVMGGFFPEVGADARPQAPRRIGLTTLGLPYAADAAITRHLAAFISRGQMPTALLFNGGVTNSPLVRERLQSMLASWGPAPRLLTAVDKDLAVSRGAAYYAYARKTGGMRIKSSTAQAYYVGIERSELAVPGVAPAVDALCIAPCGMEEGSEVSLEQTLGLVVGEPVSFRFFCSAERKGDRVGDLVNPRELTELSPIETVLEGEGVAEVRLQAQVTEVGTLELFAVGAKRWKLSFNVRVQ